MIKKRFLKWVGALGLCLSLFIIIPAVAEISSRGENTWGVYGIDLDTQTTKINSKVMAIEQIGDRIYVGGKFLEARRTSTSGPISQPYIAAFDASSGDFISSFRPKIDGAVYALQASPDGSKLFVGGEFKSVEADTKHKGIVALDPTTGEIDTTWRNQVSNSSGARGVVHELTTDGQHLYVAGRFTDIGSGDAKHRTVGAGRLSLENGAADTTFTVDTSGGAIWGISVAPDRSKVYLAGYHSSTDGNTDAANYSVLDINGKLIPSLTKYTPNNSRHTYAQDVVATGDLVFLGASQHILYVYDANTGDLITQHTTDKGGDYQDIEVVGDRVYASCHCYTNHWADHDWWNARYTVANAPDDVKHTSIQHVAAYSATDGSYIDTFILDASAARAGVWAIHGASDGCLWAGGDLSRMRGVDGKERLLGGFGKFCSDGSIDSSAPTTPGGLEQTRQEDSEITIRWEASSDNRFVTEYKIFRDGVEIGIKPGGTAPLYWFTEGSLSAGTTYNYEVVALDKAGNSSVAATVAAETNGSTLAAPATLETTLQGNDRIVLKWSKVNGAKEYLIEHNDGSGFTEVGRKTATTAKNYWFTDKQLASGTSYDYKVSAVDGSQTKGLSATLTAATTGEAPPQETILPAPLNLESSNQTGDRIVLKWSKVNGAKEYLIEREEAGTFIEVGTKTAGTVKTYWFTNRQLSRDTAYRFRVVAIAPDGTRGETSTTLTARTSP